MGEGEMRERRKKVKVGREGIRKGERERVRGGRRGREGGDRGTLYINKASFVQLLFLVVCQLFQLAQQMCTAIYTLLSESISP